MIERVDLRSEDIAAQQMAKLKELFPEVFTEGGRVDFERLRLTLGDTVDVGKERFGLTWHGKGDCFRTIQTPSVATLTPAPEESINFDTSENLFIEGDNLEVLKLLQKSYLGKVKMIYIDPPYNTGNDFVYPDDFSQGLRNYMELTGQVDSEGRALMTNKDSNGRFHSDWLNMMYPRLFLAKNLLREDGVIFISIDDNEVHNLRALCNEIFGEENFVSEIVWERSYAPVNMVKHFSQSHDYILCYSKNIQDLLCNGLPRPESTNAKYGNPDNDKRGLWRTDNLSVGPVVREKVYEITTPSGRVCLPPKGRCWLYTKERYEEMVADNRIWFGANGDNVPAPKRFLAEVKQGLTPMTIWKYNDVGHTQDSMRELREIFEGEKIFDYSKPVKLMKQVVQLYSNDNDIILDFFAGSGTTAHAVMQLNAEDGGNRKFICVQLPEPTDEKSEAAKAGYKTIAEISKERIRRAAAKIAKEEAEKAAKKTASLFDSPDTELTAPLDLGFKVFKLAPSNFKIWDGGIDKSPEAIQKALFDHIDHIDERAAQEAILYELLLKSGFELTTPIEKLTIAGKTVFSIMDNALIICLEKELTLDLVREIAALSPVRVICLDEGFNNDDSLKTNAVQIMKSKRVEDFRTV